MNRGEDKIVTIFLKDEAGAVVDPTSFLGLIVIVYQQKDQVLAKFSANAAAGFDSINNVNAVAGSFEINLKRSVFKYRGVKKLYAEVKTAENNAAFEDSKFITVSDPFVIDLLKDVETTEIDVP